MPTVKISELPEISHLSTNTEATIVVGVDLETGTTGKINVATLGEGLYAYQPLKVGENQVLFANTIGQFSGNSVTFLQINNQNFNANGSADYVASASDSDNTNKFINMGINGSQFADPVYTSMRPYDGYVFVQGPAPLSASGNLVIGTASAHANIVYIVGGTVTNNIVARMTKTDLQLSAGYNIKFGDGSVQSVAASPANYSQAIFNQANVTIGVDASQNVRLDFSNTRMDFIDGVDVSQNNRMINIESVNVLQNTAIAATDGKMQNAFIKANNALANTSGIFDGNLTITGNVLTQGTISLNNSSFATNIAFVKITASDGFVTQSPSNTNYMLHVTGKANSVTRLVLDSFGANTYPVVIGRMGRGSAAAPVAVANNDVMFRVVGNGWTGTQFPPSSPTKIDFVAGENFSDTNRGTRIEFWNTPVGSNTIQKIADFNAESAEFLGTVNPQKGFIYNPTVLVGNQTAFTIDFSTTSLIKATLAADCTISLSNYVPGKVVEVWLTNLGGPARTVTHGCTATNSTDNSTTFDMPGTSSAYLRYFSIDGDNANTFVAIQSA